MGCLHVFGRARNRNVEIEIKAKDSASDKYDEDRECGIFEIGYLDFHRSELDTPADVIVGWRWLEADVLPVCGLQIFEVVGFAEVEFFEVFCENDNRVADEEMGEMRGEEVVHAAMFKALVEVRVDNEVGIQVFLS